MASNGGSKAYIKDIVPNGSDGVHSVAPSWVLTFVRWENRYLNVPDTGNAGDRSYFLSTRDPLVVTSDCASVTVNYSKESHTPSMQAMLYPGDSNYLTSIAPGDFVFVNMLEFEEEADKIVELAKQSKAINGPESGFKGIFKIQSVRRVLAVDPATGTKKVMFQVSAFAFTEFNNTLYFNPFLLSGEADNNFLFVTRITSIWEQYVGKKGTFGVQSILKLLINATIGDGFNGSATQKKDFNITQNTHFYIPQKVGSLLGVPQAKAAKDIYNYLFGIQKYMSGQDTTLQSGMNPVIKKVSGRFYQTGTECQGSTLLKPEYWNQSAVWSVLNQYTNSPINELFTTLRISPEGNIMPTVVFRQMPFSTEKYKNQATKFLNLPRWRVSPDLLLDINLGREEAARFNFIQVFATVPQAASASNQGYISQQIAAGNFALDKLDVIRSGLKPYIVTSNFDTIVSDKIASFAPTWAKLLADALMGGHLKLNGSIDCFGIVDPIAVGDNLELDSVVYHIEGLSHSCSVQPDGKRSFKTSLEISHGVDLESQNGTKVFGQMRNPSIEAEIKENLDAENSGFFPGINKDGQDSANSPDLSFPSTPGIAPSKRKKQEKAKKRNR